MFYRNQNPRLVQGKRLRLIFGAWFLCLFSFVLRAAEPTQTKRSEGILSAKLDSQLKSLLKHGSVLVADDWQVLYRYPPKSNPLLVPASVLKLATALVALQHLKPEFRYRTDFYLGKNNSLGIKGSGDPFLISEEWKRIAKNLRLLLPPKLQAELPKKSHPTSRLDHLFFDTSFFEANTQIPGIELSRNPYDAQNGALVVNFNTINLKIEANGNVVSAEEQTPLTPLARRLSKKLTGGTHRISLSSDVGISYAGELVQSFLGREGFSFTSENLVLRPLHSGDRLTYTHINPRTLLEMIAGMMRYSNNFTANQLLLTVGAKRYGPPATLEKATGALEEYLWKELGIPQKEFTTAEGSGISRKNRLTPEAVWHLLKAFAPYQNLLHGRGGTSYKTGTLHGVYTMAGYLPGKKSLYFVIFLNQLQNSRDKILKLLLSAF